MYICMLLLQRYYYIFSRRCALFHLVTHTALASWWRARRVCQFSYSWVHLYAFCVFIGACVNYRRRRMERKRVCLFVYNERERERERIWPSWWRKLGFISAYSDTSNRGQTNGLLRPHGGRGKGQQLGHGRAWLCPKFELQRKVRPA